MAIQAASRNDRSSLILRNIPEGWFSMGCAEGRDDEKPVHRVWVDAFDLAAYQTTNADYALFLAAARHPSPPNFRDLNFSDPRQPVIAVSWHDAVAYCQWLRSITGRQFRLPTEAEWERSARGGSVDDAQYPWGDTRPEEIPNYSARWKNGPEQVGLYPPNAYGLYNLGDNVHEWCADWYEMPDITRARLTEIRVAPNPAIAEHLAAAPGAIKSR